jgi:fructokinase
VVHVVGVDVGGTKIEAILFDGKKVLKKYRTPTQADKPYKTTLANIAKAIKEVRSKETKAVGLSIAGYVHKDLLYNGPHSLREKPVVKDLQKLVKLPVVCENDANCFALAEATLGAGKEKQHVIGVIVGTGIGAGLILNGSIYRGAIGAAGEIGHSPLNDNEIEYFCSGPGIVRNYEAFGGTKKLSAADIMTYRAVIDMEKIPDEEESAIMLAQNYTYDNLARTVATLINTFNPEVIVFGGGVSKSIDYKRLSKKTEKYALPVLFKATAIKQFAIADSSGEIGAAMLALQSVKK